MTDQLELGEQAKAEAIARVDRNAERTWKAAAHAVICQICEGNNRFTTDLVWARLDLLGIPPPHEPRAMGAAMQAAARAGYCRATGDYRKSTRPECHARPIVEWESRLRPPRP